MSDLISDMIQKIRIFLNLTEEESKFLSNSIERVQKEINAEKSIKLYIENIDFNCKERFKMLTTISTLSAALLIIASFNPILVPFNILTKIIISLLLILILVGIWGFFVYTSSSNALIEKICAVSKNDLGKDISKELKDAQKLSIRKFLSWIPFIANFLATVIIILIMFLLWF